MNRVQIGFWPLRLTALIMLAALAFSAIPAAVPAAAPTDNGQLHLVILDPGHGGADGGALSSDGVRESGLNLSIALRAEQLFAFLGVQTLLTREDEELSYPPEAMSIREKKRADQKSRIELINKHPTAILVSIHQNYYPDERPSGPQVLYAGTEGSRELAYSLQDVLTNALSPGNRRTAVPADKQILLMRSVQCTAVLVECGFLSNPVESALLQTDKYQKKLAVIIVSACFAYWS